MKKRIIVTCLVLLVVIGIIAGIKVLQIRRMIARGSHFVPPPETITTALVRQESWGMTIPAVGSLEAVQGMNLTAELPGKIKEITFVSGARVKKGDLLVKFDTSSEEAQLRAAEAEATLAAINFDRIAKLVAVKSIAKAKYDTAAAKLKEARAQCDIIRAVINKKTVRAPFAGRLGIRMVDVGQILGKGAPIVTLQALDPIYVNFSLPQQNLDMVHPGITVEVTTDAGPARKIEGKITAINPEIDKETRNVKIQATLANTEKWLRPGMFVKVAVVRPLRKQVLAIPATAVLYAPYGNSVFVIEEKKNNKTGRTDKVLRQQFVRLGEKRGDFIAVVSGLKAGEHVAGAGVFKLRNGMTVVIDNALAPEYKLKPRPEDS
ncbi:MAG: efflux RND transporter periplasmic adaptor subunit [Deltaproteobacteria bacterium]|nr:efflux RND transporter periplasmic adaptor subunit [Deltaproteobacteria bacterium]